MSETLVYAKALHFYVDTDPATGRHILREATTDEVTGYMERAAEKARAYREAIEAMALAPDPLKVDALMAPQPCICVHGRSRYCPRHVD